MELPPELLEEARQTPQPGGVGQRQGDVQTAAAIPLKINPVISNPSPNRPNIPVLDAAIDQFVVKRQNGEVIPTNHFAGVHTETPRSAGNMTIIRQQQSDPTPASDIQTVTNQVSGVELTGMRTPVRRVDTPRPGSVTSVSSCSDSVIEDVAVVHVPKTNNPAMLKNTARRQINFDQTEVGNGVQDAANVSNEMAVVNTGNILSDSTPVSQQGNTNQPTPSPISNERLVSGSLQSQVNQTTAQTQQVICNQPTPATQTQQVISNQPTPSAQTQQVISNQPTPTPVGITGGVQIAPQSEITHQPTPQAQQLSIVPQTQQASVVQSIPISETTTMQNQRGVKRPLEEEPIVIADTEVPVIPAPSNTPAASPTQNTVNRRSSAKKRKQENGEIVLPKNVKYTKDGKPIPAYCGIYSDEEKYVYRKGILIPYLESKKKTTP